MPLRLSMTAKEARFSHLTHLASELAPGLRMLEGIRPNLVPLLVRPAMIEKGDMNPVPGVPFPSNLVYRMLLVQRQEGLLRHEMPEGLPDEAIATSMFYSLTWNKVILSTTDSVTKDYRLRGLAPGAPFASLFETSLQTYYLALAGEVDGFKFEGLWVFRDIFDFTGQVHLRIQPVILDPKTGRPTEDRNHPSLGVPKADTWEEVVERGAYEIARHVRASGTPRDFATLVNLTRRQAMTWEPIIALLCDVLGEDKGEAFDKAAAAAPRSDAGIATLTITHHESGLGFLAWGT